MKDWKIIAISGALAFLISFISGLIGQVSLGVLVFRAFLGAVVFAALGYGITVLLRMYLPELFELQSGESSELSDGLAGMQDGSGKVSEINPTGNENPVIDISIDDETEKSFIGGSTVGESKISAGIDNKDTDLIDEIVETGNSDESSGENQVPGNLDVLPDMGVFSNSFENTEDIEDNNSNSSGNITLDIMGEEQDPELVARALRTMVNKDQEG